VKPDIPALIEELLEHNGSDLHLVAEHAPLLRVNGVLRPAASNSMLASDDILHAVRDLVAERQFEEFKQTRELDAGVTIGDGYRLRINVYMQQDTVAAAVRLLPNSFFRLDELGLDVAVLQRIVGMHAGLVLVTGATGSGKSTTIASLVNEINQTRSCHIHTIEDPVEYRHISKKALVTQREVGRDTASFAEALRRSMREDPDVIVVGEMRDLETTATALTLAETGHLTFATLHTSDAVQTVSRIVSQFPAAQQAQVNAQLASTLRFVICQQLVPWDDGRGRSLTAEILTVSSAVRSLIRDGKVHQIRNAIQTGQADGMQTMDQSLHALVRTRRVALQAAAQYSHDPQVFLQEAQGR
jgi:twitching motility protein PilT